MYGKIDRVIIKYKYMKHEFVYQDQIDQILWHSNFNPIHRILITPERYASSALASVIYENKQTPIAIATLAPNSIKYQNQAEIPALYTIPSFRGRGLAKIALTSLLKEAQELGFNRIHLDATSRSTRRIYDTLPNRIRRAVVLHDSGNYIDDLMRDEEQL